MRTGKDKNFTWLTYIRVKALARKKKARAKEEKEAKSTVNATHRSTNPTEEMELNSLGHKGEICEDKKMA